MGLEAGFPLESAEVETIPAAGVENYVPGRCGDGVPDRESLLLCKTPVMETPPRCDSFRGIARPFGSPLLRLKQVDVPAPSDVEGMPAGADHRPFGAHQAEPAASYWA